MRALKPLLIGLAIVVVVAIYFVTYSVHETERAIRFEFGRVVDVDLPPGLHFKLPWQNVRKFDGRVQTLDEDPQRFLTSEKKNVIVDAFVKWRIGDVEPYYTTVGGDPRRANLRLSEIIKNGLRNEFGKRTINDVVSGDRAQIMEILYRQASEGAASLGLEVVDVRIKRIDLPQDVSQSVFNRMAAERERVAREFRAEGAQEAEQIRADADRQRSVIIAEARRDGEKIRGEGDAKAAQTYAQAYNADPDFYSFYRSLGAYREAFRDKGDMLILSPDSQFFRYFDQSSGAGQPSPAPR